MNLSLSNSNLLSRNTLWRTQAFLTRTHLEKRDRDPRVFLARSVTHYSLSWTQAFLTRTHSVETDCEELKPFWLELIQRNVTVILGFFWPNQPLIINLAWILGFSGPRCHSVVEERALPVFLARPNTFSRCMHFGFSWPDQTWLLLKCMHFGDSNLTRHDFTEECVLPEFKPDQTLLGLHALREFKPDQTRLTV